MKKILMILFTTIVGMLLAADLSVDQIIEKIDANERVESSYSTGKQIIELHREKPEPWKWKLIPSI